jgi:mono/diheme cytochrome c family protein
MGVSEHVRRALVPGLAMLGFTTALIAGQGQAGTKGNPEAAKIKNPVAATPESIAAGKKSYDSYCGGCHGTDAKGGLVLSVIEDRGGTQPPDLTDEKWDHGSSDGELFAVTKKGVPPDYFMGPWDGRITDTEIWNVINYLRSLAPKK